MFDVKSDFALNKAREDTIVYKSVTGVHTELKQEDFSSSEEFRRLWMHHVDGLSMTEIAKREHVARQRINQSLLDAYKRIVNNL